ncbi:MAG: 50S ribosomal protein L10 [Kiritimatiellia bacterium]|nr:50S ribosomal protein L10 [Kiritimatiellia bacterium]
MRPDKVSIVNEIRSRIAGVSHLILTNYKGMKVGQAKEMRQRLAKQKSEFYVVKNSYFKKAVSDLPGIKIEEELDFPLAIVFGKGDGLAVAKVIDGFTREYNVAVIAGGFLDGRRFSADEFRQLVKLPPRTTLLGMLAGVLAAPISSLATVMRQKTASVIYALKAVQELKSKSSNK